MLELFSAMCGLIQSILIMFKRKENWIFYLANIITLTIFSLSAKLYGDVIENSVYVFFGFLGLFTWYNTKISNKLSNKYKNISYCNKSELIFYIGLLFAISSVTYFCLLHTDDVSPFLDAITTGMGFTATLMMATKKVESWIVWFVDDIIMAYIYFMLPDRGFWLMLLNIIWVGLAFGSFIIWHKEAMKNKKNYN